MNTRERALNSKVRLEYINTNTLVMGVIKQNTR